jgi:hypothetical protein
MRSVRRKRMCGEWRNVNDMEPRTREQRDAQAEREELAEEYRALGRLRETDTVIVGLIAELRERLAERVKG